MWKNGFSVKQKNQTKHFTYTLISFGCKKYSEINKPNQCLSIFAWILYNVSASNARYLLCNNLTGGFLLREQKYYFPSFRYMELLLKEPCLALGLEYFPSVLVPLFHPCFLSFNFACISVWHMVPVLTVARTFFNTDFLFFIFQCTCNSWNKHHTLRRYIHKKLRRTCQKFPNLSIFIFYLFWIWHILRFLKTLSFLRSDY